MGKEKEGKEAKRRDPPLFNIQTTINVSLGYVENLSLILPQTRILICWKKGYI